MTTPYIPRLSRWIVFILLGVSLLDLGCRRRGRALEVAYVSAPQVNLRDRVAAVYTKAGLVSNGERVEIIDRDRRFAKVRTSGGVEGWMEQRYLVSQAVYDKLQQLTKQSQNDPIQGEATTRNDTNLHVEPGRDSEHLYQIGSGGKVALLRRSTAEKPGTVVPAKDVKSGGESEAKPVVEDWWLVRDARGRVGWILARMVDLDLPLDIAQYAEGQRIVAYFVLDQVRDGDKQVSQYLTALTEPKDGLVFDFNQVRVFTWNTKRHRYETAYRERLKGVLPITVAQENFEKEGTLPTFAFRVRDDNGTVTDRKYKLNTPIVRRVLAPGEEASKKRR
ncbi:MAG TPA: SH3 domain-containing protein [Terriglobales bacterium]|nr:SH3 domain-containing protein [Terriglobales bacterium]